MMVDGWWSGMWNQKHYVQNFQAAVELACAISTEPLISTVFSNFKGLEYLWFRQERMRGTLIGPSRFQIVINDMQLPRLMID